MLRRALLLATVLCVLAPRGQAGGAQPAPPLSDEDADVVKQLALLEEVELLRNLDLFEGKSAESAQTADAGVAPDAGAVPDAGTGPRR